MSTGQRFNYSPPLSLHAIYYAQENSVAHKDTEKDSIVYYPISNCQVILLILPVHQVTPLSNPYFDSLLKNYFIILYGLGIKKYRLGEEN